MKTYDIFKGHDLEIAELIQQRRLQILVRSCIYYELNQNNVPDMVWDRWAKELVELQRDYPGIASQVRYAEAFDGFDGSTGFDLPIKDKWVVNKARQLCKYGTQKKQKQSKKKGRLF